MLRKLKDAGSKDEDVPLFYEEVSEFFTSSLFMCLLISLVSVMSVIDVSRFLASVLWFQLKNRLDFKVNHLTSLMVSKREFLEEAKLLRDAEKEKLNASQQEANTMTNVQQSSSPEENVNT